MAWPVVEDGFRLDVHRVVVAGRHHSGPFSWRWTRDGEPAGDIVVETDIHDPASGALLLRYRCNGVSFDQRFRLESIPCRMGGVRWFAVCPVTAHRAAKLYSLGGAGFHTRTRYGRVAYRTQRAAKPIDRVLMRRDRILFRKLRGNDPTFAPKPKWMRWTTYNSWLVQLEEAEAQLDVHMAALVVRMGGRL